VKKDQLAIGEPAVDPPAPTPRQLIDLEVSRRRVSTNVPNLLV
jgi:hypothetical protein